MSGLEVIAGVTGIILAFNKSVTLYRSWRQKKTERLANQQNENLECSLTSGEVTIRQEYDTYYRRLGQRFAVGDGKFILAY
jgi:hypothetical protein